MSAESVRLGGDVLLPTAVYRRAERRDEIIMAALIGAAITGGITGGFVGSHYDAVSSEYHQELSDQIGTCKTSLESVLGQESLNEIQPGLLTASQTEACSVVSELPASTNTLPSPAALGALAASEASKAGEMKHSYYLVGIISGALLFAGAGAGIAHSLNRKQEI